MDILKDFSSKQCEILLSQINCENGDSSLVLPLKAKATHFGGAAYIAQVILTWARKYQSGDIVTFAEEADQIDDLIRGLHGLVAATISRSATTRTSKRSIQKDFFQAAIERLQIMHGGNPERAARGNVINIVCADHLNLSEPRIFFSRKDGVSKLRSEEEFKQLIVRRLLRPIIPLRYSKVFDQSELNFLGSMVYELFKNTEEHAKTDIEGNLLSPAVRVVQLAQRQVEQSTLESFFNEFPTLGELNELLSPATQYAEKYQLIELSILDSGPGFASRLCNKPLNEMTLQEEFEAVSECFNKNISSKPSPHYGQGLPYVVKLLKRHNGFMRIRTGRLSLVLKPSDQNQPRLRLRDATNIDQLTELSPTVGTLITIILPMVKS